MSECTLLAQRTFVFDDQRRFAQLSGDSNPLHLDPVAARRTQAGAPVVHGVNLALWAIDALAAGVGSLPRLCKLRVRFTKFVYVDELAELQLTALTAQIAKLRVCAAGTVTAQMTIEFGEPMLPSNTNNSALRLFPQPVDPLNLAFDALGDCAGRLAFATPPDQIAAMYPAAAAWVGERCLAALIASTNLVGMVSPGLHSIYNALSVHACSGDDLEDTLRFRVSSTDPRFRLVSMSIEGGGLVGQVESFARVPPTSQPSMESLTALVNPSEFLGHSVLIIGGSRGIGELTAKLLAAGGARTIVTYRMGKSDAERVAREIRAAGGLCDAMPYDARLPADPQLACLPDVPTHLYYYATPPIQNRSAELYRHERLEELLAVYVAGFQHLAQALYERRPDLSVFYPSTVFIDERPRGMLEYAMAKVAGELLCADLNQTRPNQRILVSRLPRMATDQTAAVIPVDMHSAVATLLPLVRDVQSRFTERA